MIVIDAGVLATALADDSPTGAGVRRLLEGRRFVAPELIDLEVTSVLRKLASKKVLSDERAAQAVVDLSDFPVRRASHLPLLGRCWALRENLTVYDAAYVALAEALDVRMLTADARLARTPGPRCEFELISPT